MNKQSLEKLEREVERRLKARERRKRRRMPVSGGEVKKLQRLIVSLGEIRRSRDKIIRKRYNKITPSGV